MKTDSADLLSKILDHSLPGITALDHFIFPDYHGRTIANLPGSICQWLQAKPLGLPLHSDYLQHFGAHYRQVILVVVDGLGWDMLHRMTAEKPELSNRYQNTTILPLGSVAPSTTSAALTSLWTGAAPGQHGIVGYEIWLKEFNLIANLIQFSPTAYTEPGVLQRMGLHPETFVSLPRLGHHLAAQGISTTAYLPAAISRSTLTQMHTGGAALFGYRSTADLWVTLRQAVTRPTTDFAYHWVYIPEMDTLSHIYGPNDERITMEFEAFSNQLFHLAASLPSDVLLLVTADHGQIATPQEPKFELARQPVIQNQLMMSPFGESRLAYLLPRGKTLAELQQQFQTAWPGEFDLRRSAEWAAAGLFGPPETWHPALLDRIGEYTAAALDCAYIWWAPKENHLLGRHGGLSRAEMLVPLIQVFTGQ